MDKFVQHCLSRLSVYEDTKEMPRKLFKKKQKTSMFLKSQKHNYLCTCSHVAPKYYI